MSAKTRAARLLDDLFSKPSGEFKPPMGPPVKKSTADKLGHLLERAKHNGKRGLTDAELAEKEQAQKAKKDAAVKAFRERRRQQLAEAKKALVMPIQEIRAAAHARREAEQLDEANKKLLDRLVNNPNSGMSTGEHLTDATSEEKALARPVTGWRSNSTNSEASNFDLIINYVGDGDIEGSSFPGIGHEADSSESRKDTAEGDPVDSGLGSKFVVNLDDSASERQRVFIEFFHDNYASIQMCCKVCPKCQVIADEALKSGQDEGDVLCKICQRFIQDDQDPEQHMQENHDILVDKIRKKIVKIERDLKREAKKRGPLPGTLPKPTVEDAARDGFTQTGGWVQLPGGKWVQEYTNKPRRQKQ